MSYPRLRSGAEIRAVFGARRAAHGSAMVVRARARGDDAPGRAAVVAGRRLGTAVVRNRVKRRLRAVLEAQGLPAGYDLVVVARLPTSTADFAGLSAEFERLVRRATEPGEEPAA